MTTTSISFHLRPSQSEGRRPGKLFIRIIRARQIRHIPRDYSVFPDEWDIENKRINLPPTGGMTDRNGEIGSCGNPDRNSVLLQIEGSIKSDLKRLREIVARLEEDGDYTASDVAVRFTESLNGDTVFGYAEIMSGRLLEQGRERTARAYRSAARSLMNFKDGKAVLLSEIDAPLMTGYERHLLNKGLKLNTVSFYLRNLRAMYFRAVGEKIIPQQESNPFAGMHTGVYETKRRALDDKQLQALSKLDELLSEKPKGSKANKIAVGEQDRRKKSELRDSLLLFMFCYHARGMSFVDMAHLRWENIGEETLIYRRRKTGGLLEVTITKPMQKILSHFASQTQGSDFVFPIIDPSRSNARRQYEAGLKKQNRLLKTLAQMAGITESLSTHAARHTWATLAKRMHVPVAVIGEALGHRDVKTTSIYLASFDRATMDELSAKLSEAAKAA